MQFKLANVVLKVEKHAKDFPELYYRVLSGDASYNGNIHSLHINGNVDFLTYASQTYQNHLPEKLETRPGQSGTTCRPSLNHLPSTTEQPARHAKITCVLWQNHLEDPLG